MMIPLSFTSRTDVSPATKLVIGYIFTRSNIETNDWLLIASDVEKQTGLSRKTIYRCFKDLESNQMIKFETTEKYRKTEFPTRIYSINKTKMKDLSSYTLKFDESSESGRHGHRSQEDTGAGVNLSSHRSQDDPLQEYNLKRISLDKNIIVQQYGKMDSDNAGIPVPLKERISPEQIKIKSSQIQSELDLIDSQAMKFNWPAEYVFSQKNQVIKNLGGNS